MTKVFQFPLKTLVDSSNETFKVLQQLEDSSKTELFSRTFFSLNGEGERKVCGNSYKISHRFPEYKNSFLFLNFLKRFSLEYWFACVFELVDFVLEFFFLFFCKWKLFTYIYEQSQWYWYLFDLILQRSRLFCILHKISWEKILLSSKNIFKMFHISRNN